MNRDALSPEVETYGLLKAASVGPDSRSPGRPPDVTEQPTDQFSRHDTDPQYRLMCILKYWHYRWGLAAIAIVILVSIVQTVLNGPQFIVALLILGGAATLVGVHVRLEASMRLLPFVITALATYEAIAAVHLVYGLTHGMHRFLFLYLVMAGGFFVATLLIRRERFGVATGTFDRSSCGCGGCGG